MKAADIIKEFEGYKTTAYLCSAGVPTIGYGSTFYADGSKVKMGDKITKQQAEILLQIEIENIKSQIERKIFVPINENQLSAIVSMAYNIGVSAFLKSTLLKKINARSPRIEIEAEFLKWVRAGGKVVKGLQNRRQKEVELFYKPIGE